MDEDRVADIWGARAPYSSGARWPERVDQFLVDGVADADVQRWVPGACLLCSNGCGLDVAVSGGRMVGVRGRRGDRVNHGRLGPKGLDGWRGGAKSRASVRDSALPGSGGPGLLTCLI
jgi:anaerobic selenocysteine-containing dehydrogenase